MGYRSEVGVLITCPKKVSGDKILATVKKVYGGAFSCDFDEVKQFKVDGDRVVYLHCDWVKWYESFEDVGAFMEYIGSWKSRYKTGGVHYVRIGEYVDDVEEACYGEPEHFLDVYRSVGFQTGW